jgi:hypothetical protein
LGTIYMQYAIESESDSDICLSYTHTHTHAHARTHTPRTLIGEAPAAPFYQFVPRNQEKWCSGNFSDHTHTHTHTHRKRERWRKR